MRRIEMGHCYKRGGLRTLLCPNRRPYLDRGIDGSIRHLECFLCSSFSVKHEFKSF